MRQTSYDDAIRAARAAKLRRPFTPTDAANATIAIDRLRQDAADARAAGAADLADELDAQLASAEQAFEAFSAAIAPLEQAEIHYRAAVEAYDTAATADAAGTLDPAESADLARQLTVARHALAARERMLIEAQGKCRGLLRRAQPKPSDDRRRAEAAARNLAAWARRNDSRDMPTDTLTAAAMRWFPLFERRELADCDSKEARELVTIAFARHRQHRDRMIAAERERLAAMTGDAAK